jgi:hypothetical protein
LTSSLFAVFGPFGVNPMWIKSPVFGFWEVDRDLGVRRRGPLAKVNSLVSSPADK